VILAGPGPSSLVILEGPGPSHIPTLAFVLFARFSSSLHSTKTDNRALFEGSTVPNVFISLFFLFIFTFVELIMLVTFQKGLNKDLTLSVFLVVKPLLFRFDLIFLILDQQDEVYDKRLARHLVSLYYRYTQPGGRHAKSVSPIC
jgi:hypothetical protein